MSKKMPGFGAEQSAEKSSAPYAEDYSRMRDQVSSIELAQTFGSGRLVIDPRPPINCPWPSRAVQRKREERSCLSWEFVCPPRVWVGDSSNPSAGHWEAQPCNRVCKSEIVTYTNVWECSYPFVHR